MLQFEQQFRKPKLPDIRPGDTVRVYQRVEEGGKTRTHQFEGTVIATKHGRGLSGSFTVRKIGAQGVGIEQTFFWHAPTLFKVERIRKGDTRRAKLYYLRRLTSREAKRLAGAHVGEIWEEEAVKEAVEQQQAAQAEQEAKGATSDEGEKLQEQEKPVSPEAEDMHGQDTKTRAKPSPDHAKAATEAEGQKAKE
jgi:large subunit ribosomal protein L19